MLDDPRRVASALRVVSVAEAVSFLLLLVATAVKYGAEQEAGVQVLGPLHGVLFLAFVLGVLVARDPLRWDVRTTLLALVLAVVPAGGFVVERWLRSPARGDVDPGERPREGARAARG